MSCGTFYLRLTFFHFCLLHFALSKLIQFLLQQLLLVKLGVHTALLDQFVVCSPLDNPSFIQDDNLISVLHS